MLNSINEKSGFRKLLIKTTILLTFLFLLPVSKTYAEGSIKTAVYFTGIGCPHCSNVSPILHEAVEEGSFILIEYEIYQETNNSKVLYNYSDTYNLPLSIPTILYSNEISRTGDKDIEKYLEQDIENINEDIVLLFNSTTEWGTLDMNKLEGIPTIFAKDRVVIKQSSNSILSEGHNEMVKNFLTLAISESLKTLHGAPLTNEESKTVMTSGGDIAYEQGLEIDGWTILWNGEEPINIDVNCEDVDPTQTQDSNCQEDISLVKVIVLALADSINPCALSVLTMMLITIITYHSNKPKEILKSGLMFVFAVFFTYIIYGLLIVRAFQVLQSISTIKLYLYNGLGITAIILGLLELKDFFFYKPGSVGTEMPLFLRPKVQKVIAKITSPAGAFGLGMFVTLFLLPCTVGPYIILGGILSVTSLLATLPYLLLYNFVFVLPMIIIVVLVFFSTERIKNIDIWRKKNIKKIHLAIGTIFILLGIVMLTGLI